MPWTNFAPGGTFVTVQTLDIVDPYLAWAENTAFADFLRSGDPQANTVPVLVELVAGKNPSDLDKALGANGTVGSAYTTVTNTRYCSARFTAAACVAFATPGNNIVERYEFAMPIIPQRPRRISRPAATAGTPNRTIQAKGQTVLLGVIDTGCPFAHANFRNGMTSRFLNIWDQDDHPAFGVAPAAGGLPADFGYGREVNRSMLNALLAAFVAPGGSVDEDGCYERAQYPELRRRSVHGAHVLDQFIGPRRLGSRIFTTPDKPPSWANDSLSANEADVVFVQVPRDAPAGPAGNGVTTSILDGLKYILSCAGPDTSEIIVNISTAINTGPHNDSTIMLQAISEMVATEAIETPKKPARTLSICMAAGNALQSRWHARDDLAAGARGRVCLHVPPDNQAATLVQVWCESDPRGVQVSVTAPGTGGGTSLPMVIGATGITTGRVFTSDAGTPLATALLSASGARGWSRARSSTRATSYLKSSMLMLAIEPTETPDRPGASAPYGNWIIDIANTSSSVAAVWVYVARSETDLNQALRGRPAHLVDPDYDPTRYMKERKDDVHAYYAPEPIPPTLPGTVSIRRRGTICGSATSTDVMAIAAYCLHPRPAGKPSDYSSAGPPDPFASAACEESDALLGVRGAGSRSGCVVRMSGTSFASPQYARAVANHSTVTVPTLDPGRWGTNGKQPP